MKTSSLSLSAVLLSVLLSGCEHPSFPSDAGDAVRRVTFAVDGDFVNPVFTRGELTANGTSMTDLWVFDFVDDAPVQSVHQVSSDASFGRPSLPLSYGEHNLCFVVSRGDNPVVDESTHTLTWSRPSDTFWADLQLTVSPTSASEQTVMLRRVATRLRIAVSDLIPAAFSTLTLTPHRWYNGLDYWLGVPASVVTDADRTASVPSSYIGTVGTFSMNIFGMSGDTEWTTSVIVTAHDSDGGTLSSVTIPSAPFLANRQTAFSGRLFSGDHAFSLSLDDTWSAGYSGEW